MGEIISGFFGMIWTLIGVIFQLALPVALVLVICIITKKVLINPITKYYVDYTRGKKRRLKQIHEIQQHAHHNIVEEQKHEQSKIKITNIIRLAICLILRSQFISNFIRALFNLLIFKDLILLMNAY